jgi:hypothetical protein
VTPLYNAKRSITLIRKFGFFWNLTENISEEIKKSTKQFKRAQNNQKDYLKLNSTRRICFKRSYRLLEGG